MARTSLRKLAGQLASVYYKASWPDVEDDVSLCIWVRKKCGEELAVKRAAKLRTAA